MIRLPFSKDNPSSCVGNEWEGEEGTGSWQAVGLGERILFLPSFPPSFHRRWRDFFSLHSLSGLSPPAPGGGILHMIFQSRRTCLGPSSRLAGYCAPKRYSCLHHKHRKSACPVRPSNLLSRKIWHEHWEFSLSPSTGFFNTPELCTLVLSGSCRSINKFSFFLLDSLLDSYVGVSFVRDSQTGFWAQNTLNSLW